MNFTKDISFYPTTLIKNSRLIINYTGKLSNSNKIFLEYDYKDFRGTDNPNTNVVEMLSVSDYFYALINLNDSDHIYFRFVDNFGSIDDLNGITYCEQIHENANSVLNNLEVNSNATNDETTYNLFENNTIENHQSVVNSQINNISLSENDTKESNTSSTPESLAMIPMKEKDLIKARKGLRFTYKLNKRIRLILIKIFRSLPSFITGNYRRRINL